MPLTALASFIERHRGLLLRATSVWTATGVLLYVWAPLVTPVLLVLAPLGPIAWFIASGRRIPVGSPSPVIVMLAVAGVYLAINASWSLSRSDALVALGSFFLFLAAVHVTANTMAECEADILRGIAIGLYAGMVIGGVVLCFETSTLQWLHRTLSSLIPPLRPKPRDMVLDGDWVVFVQSFLINRNIAALTSFFWPTMLAVFLLTPDVRRRPRLLLGLVPMVAAIFGSKHATSKIAFIGAAVAFAIVSISPAVARRGMAWGWVAVIALVVPLATLAYQSHLYLATWLAPSAQHRIVIWGHTSQLIAQVADPGRRHQHRARAQ